MRRAIGLVALLWFALVVLIQALGIQHQQRGHVLPPTQGNIATPSTGGGEAGQMRWALMRGEGVLRRW